MSDTEAPVMYAPESHEQSRDNGPCVNVGKQERFFSGLFGGFMTLYGLKHRSPLNLALMALGGALIYRGATGHCHVYKAMDVDTAAEDDKAVRHALHSGIEVERWITIDKPVEAVYSAWRQLENLPQFMKHLKRVEQIDEKHSRWVARAPAGMSVEWEAEIVQETPNEVLAWKSLPGSDVINAGTVRFESTPEGGTELHVKLRYVPPGSRAGAAIARAFGEEPGKQMTSDLRRFKQMVEFGDFADEVE